MKIQNRNVVLFLDNGTSQQESIEKNLSNIKLLFPPKNTTSGLQPFDCFFYLDFLSRTFTNHRTAGERGGHFFNSSLPLPPSSQTLRYQPGDYCRELTSANGQQPGSNREPLFSDCKLLITKPRSRYRNYKSLQLKYHKLLIRHVISRVDDNKRASNIINEINISKVIGWVKSALREVTSDTIKHYLKKCGFPTDDYVATAQDSDEEFKIYLMKYHRIVLLTNMLR